MPNTYGRFKAKKEAVSRKETVAKRPLNSQGQPLKVGQIFGENVFYIDQAKGIPAHVKKEVQEVSSSGKELSRENAVIIANAVTEWALEKGASHFCHWFQPLTGSTAEKHDAFLSLHGDRPIEKLSASQLVRGEPDASSFPNGGSRATFEARGYTSWDISSPMFIMEGTNGKTLCIPTAFISYNGDALDIKTPLLRSVHELSAAATEFVNLTREDGTPECKRVDVTCGTEQEYFLVDKAFYHLRPDLVMTGRTLQGSLMAKNQQLDDHYFGAVQDRVLAYMHELELELYRLGVPAKTRHNEVAPGQFEIAPIFKNANISSDHNQLVMALIKKVAKKHDFVALLHEKPFAGVNGSGKHLNWSMADDQGKNLLSPGEKPHENSRFLAVVSIILEAVFRHGGMLRTSIASHSNDHRLGANEAPPSIISVYLGDTLGKIFESLGSEGYEPAKKTLLDMGANSIVTLSKDNTDRNRTSPFAFTGNRFEVRAVGSSTAIGFPMSILNTAVAEVFQESNQFLKAEIESGTVVDEALGKLSVKWRDSAKAIIFNGDNYSDEWVKEAESRGLPNYRTTADALVAMSDPKNTEFLTKMTVYNKNEIETKYNVMLERYITHRDIEFKTLRGLIQEHILPSAFEYKAKLAGLLRDQKELGLSSRAENEVLSRVGKLADDIYSNLEELFSRYEEAHKLSELELAGKIATELLPLSEKVSELCNELEDSVPDTLWTLPKYYDLLFVN